MSALDDLVGGPVARCNRCGRITYSIEIVGTEDRMPQPDGNPCGGRFTPEPDGYESQ